MIVSIFGILIVTAGLMIFPGNQLIPTVLAQEDSMTESTLGNTTESTLGNTTESSEDEKIQGQGTISRKH
jgi:lipopolysaccharide export LptBFGC system permease protein LptF